MNILVLRGDGVGPEVVAQALKVLGALRREGLPIELAEAAIGAGAFEKTGTSLPAETLELARRADAILFRRDSGSWGCGSGWRTSAGG